MISIPRAKVVSVRAAAILLLASLVVASVSCRQKVASPVAHQPMRQAPAAETKKPNLLLIVIDTVRADRLSLYGYRKPTTPFLDQFAQRSTKFASAYAQGVWTRTAIPSLLTSTYVSEHGNVSYRPPLQQLPSCEPDLVETLAGSGYDTAAFTGTVLPGSFYDSWGWQRGFAYMNVDWYAHDAHAREYPRKEPRMHRQLDANIVRDFSDWLLDRNTAKPFFAYLHLLGGHGPYETPDRYALKFLDKDSRQRFLKEFGHSYHWDPARAAEHPDELRYISDAYDADVRFTDQNIRYVIEELDKRGLAANTVIAIVADHGENLLELGLPSAWQHGGTNPPRQPITHIPLIIAGPNVPKGKVVTDDVMQIDVAPTLLALAGVQPPPTMRGINLMNDAAVHERKGAITESDFFHKIKAVAMGRWKYIRTFADANLPYSFGAGVAGETLVDLASDPEEKVDISAAHPDQTRRMRNLLASRVLGGASGWHVRVRGTGTPESYVVRVNAASDVRWVALFYQHPDSPVDIKTVASSSVVTLPAPTSVGAAGLTLAASRLPRPAQAYVFGAFVRPAAGATRLRMWMQNNPKASKDVRLGGGGAWALVWGYSLGPLTAPPVLEIHVDGSPVMIRDAFVSPAEDSFAWETLKDTKHLAIPFTLADGMMDVNVQFVDEKAPVTIEVLQAGHPLEAHTIWVSHQSTVRNPMTVSPGDAFWASQAVQPVGNRLAAAEVYYSGLCGGNAARTDAKTATEAEKRLRALGYLQ